MNFASYKELLKRLTVMEYLNIYASLKVESLNLAATITN